MDNELVVTRSVTINAPASRVWEALTNSSYTKRYMYGLNVESDWEPGSTVTWTGDSGGTMIFRKGRVLKIDPGRFLKISDFNPAAGAADVEKNYAYVTYTLKESGGATVLTVITDHLNGDEARKKDSEGFWDRVLTALKVLLETAYG